MELFHVFWDDGKRLFLEFKKDEKENQILLPEQIKRLNLKFDISKTTMQKLANQPPYLISIKKLYYSNEFLCFTVDLDEIFGLNDLQIRILKLTIFLYSGQRIEYKLEEKFNISDVWVNEDCYVGFDFIDLGLRKNQHSTFIKEKVFQEVKTDFNHQKRESTVIYEKNSIKNISVDDSIVSMISESNKTLKNIEFHLKNLNNTLLNMPTTNLSYSTPPRLPGGSSETAIERIRVPSKPALIQSQMTSGRLMVIQEMKTIFSKNIEENSDFNVKEILKPMTEEELIEMMPDEELLKKKEEEAIRNQIERLKNKKKKEIKLENLKKPK
ncbi:MAG: hypothetical protein ACW986_05215 [Promethearchaeota archaeon]|jgi:hypothetical protein